MRRLPQIPLLAVLSVVLLGCGGPEIEVSLSPAEAVLLRGGSARIFLTIKSTRLDTAGDFTVEGVPPGVTARFLDPWGNVVGGPMGGAPLPTPSQLVLTAAEDAHLGPATLTIVASHQGERLAEEALSIDVQGLTVTGRIEVAPGIPIGGLTVRVRGLPETLTAADGTFTIDGAPSPYDLTVASVPTREAHTWLGLTTTAVRVVPFFRPPAMTPRARLSGSLSGLATPPMATDNVVVIPAGHDQVVYGRASLTAGMGSFGFDVALSGASPAPTTVHALQSRGTVTGTTFLGYGRQDIALVDGEESALSVALSPVETARMTGSIALPLGVTVSELFASVEVGPHAAIRLPVSNSGSHTPTFDVPVIPGSTYAFGTAATSASGSLILGWTTGLATDSTPRLELSPPVNVVAPADGISGVSASTEFIVSNPAGGALTFAFESDGPDVVTQLVTTMAPSAQLQDLRGLGLTTPPGSAYRWRVFSAPGMTSVDAAASNGGTLGHYISMAFVSILSGPFPQGTGSLGLSEARTFTLESSLRGSSGTLE